jgi:hypothetical protein
MTYNYESQVSTTFKLKDGGKKTDPVTLLAEKCKKAPVNIDHVTYCVAARRQRYQPHANVIQYIHTYIHNPYL